MSERVFGGVHWVLNQGSTFSTREGYAFMVFFNRRSGTYRLVALHCLADGLNIIFMSVLAGEGNTRWMLIVSGGLHVGFVSILLTLSLLGATIDTFWVTATIFVRLAAVMWIIRFRSRTWENKRVIGGHPIDIDTMPLPGA